MIILFILSSWDQFNYFLSFLDMLWRELTSIETSFQGNTWSSNFWFGYLWSNIVFISTSMSQNSLLQILCIGNETLLTHLFLLKCDSFQNEIDLTIFSVAKVTLRSSHNLKTWIMISAKDFLNLISQFSRLFGLFHFNCLLFSLNSSC